MTPEQLHILQHSLGVDQYGLGEQYRNHYVGGAEECRPLVEMGYMTEHKASEITGGDPLFTVTIIGKQAMRLESPKPPKITRSQQRMIDYRNFADAWDCTFKEFLQVQKTDWYKRMKAGESNLRVLEDYLK
jgi:hypothetical protein